MNIDALVYDPKTPQGKPMFATAPEYLLMCVRLKDREIWRISTMVGDDEYGLEDTITQADRKVAGANASKMGGLMHRHLVRTLNASLRQRYGAPGVKRRLGTVLTREDGTTTFIRARAPRA